MISQTRGLAGGDVARAPDGSWNGQQLNDDQLLIVDRAEGGIVLNFDHNNFATVDGARAWTIGWATKMLALKKYAETGRRDPFFT
jgi:hypothetical protein